MRDAGVVPRKVRLKPDLGLRQREAQDQVTTPPAPIATTRSHRDEFPARDRNRLAESGRVRLLPGFGFWRDDFADGDFQQYPVRHELQLAVGTDDP